MLHNIEIKDIIVPEFCPYLGHKLRSSGRYSNSPSIDRIDSSKGYVKGNIQVISWEANQLKKQMTHEAFSELAAFYRAENDYENYINSLAA